jgi:hypothetical protein
MALRKNGKPSNNPTVSGANEGRKCLQTELKLLDAVLPAWKSG